MSFRDDNNATSVTDSAEPKRLLAEGAGVGPEVGFAVGANDPLPYWKKWSLKDVKFTPPKPRRMIQTHINNNC